MNGLLGTGGAAMAAEMAEQPRALERLLSHRRSRLGRGGQAQPTPRAIVLLARGSSDHAATYGRYLLEAALGIPVVSCAPSIWTRYRRRARLDGQLMIAMSQSGRTPEIAEVLKLAACAGASTLAITNELDSPLAGAAGALLGLGVGPERAVPATKSFLGQLLALAIVAEQLGAAPWARDDPERIPDALRELLEDPGAVDAVVDEIARARAVVQVGGGYLYAVAQEGALKLIETASVPVLSYSPADVLHGPIALVGPDVPVVCYSTPGPLADDVRRVADEALARGARVVWAGEGAPAAVHELPVHAVLPEALMPMLHTVRAQQLALAVSRALGVDADRPLGLTKVTLT